MEPVERGTFRRLTRKSLLTLRPFWLHRGRFYAVWIAAHGVLAVLPAMAHGRLDWPPLNAWVMLAEVRPGGGVPIYYSVMPLEANYEGTPINTYTIVLWSIVAALALAQAIRPANGSRWIWLAGWLVVGAAAAVIAAEEHYELKGYLGHQVAWLDPIPTTIRWEVVVAPFVAVPGAIAGYVLYKSVAKHAILSLLFAVACVLFFASLAHEIVQYNVWMDLLEEGSEMMAGSLMSVILAELLLRHFVQLRMRNSG